MKRVCTALAAVLWVGLFANSAAAHDTPPEGPIGSNYFQESDITKINPAITILRRNTPPTSFGEAASGYAKYPLNGVVAENLAKCGSGYTSITTQMICYAEIWADGCSMKDTGVCGSQASKTDVAETSPTITCDPYLATTYGCTSGTAYTYRPNFNTIAAGRGCSGAKALWTAGAPGTGTGGGAGKGYLDIAVAYGYSSSNVDSASGDIWDNQNTFITAANTVVGGVGELDSILQFDGTYITTGGCDTSTCRELTDPPICVFPPARLADATMTKAGVRFDWEVGDDACDDQSNCPGDPTATDYFVDLIADNLAYWGANGCGGSGCAGANLSLLMDDLFGVNAPASGLTALSLSTILNHGSIHKLFIQMSEPEFRKGSAAAEWDDQLGEVFDCPSACGGNTDPATNDPRLANIALIFGLTGESSTTSEEINTILITWGIDTMDMWPNNSTEGGEAIYPDIQGIACSLPGSHVSTIGWTPLVNERQILAMGYPPLCPGEDAYF